MSVPFPNDYACRAVAEKDAKACTVCYKPTCTVLLSSNKADFFYICPAHLKDPTFATPVHPEEYTKLVKERGRLETEVKRANEAAEAVRPYSWNKLMTNIGWNENKTAADGEKAAKDTEKDTKDKKSTYEDMIAKANALKKEWADANDAVATFKFRNYTLDGAMYKSRLNGVIQAKVRQKRQQQIQDGSLFPSAPTTSLG